MENVKQDDPVFVRTAAEIVMKHFDQHGFSGNDLAFHLRLSREQTHRKLKKDTTLSTGKFIQYIRLLNAYGLLLNTRLTVAEIGYKVGFESPAYFNKCFKDEFGIPPGDVKKNGKTLKFNGRPVLDFYYLPEILPVLIASGLKFEFEKIERPPRKQLRLIFAISFLIIISLVSIAYYRYKKPFSGLSQDMEGRIAIIPFDNQTGDSLLAPIGDIASSWISSRLDDLGNVKIVPYFTIREYLPYRGVLPEDPNGKPTLAQVINAEYFITGSYFIKRKDLSVEARLVDAESQKIIYSVAPVTGPIDSVMQILDKVQLRIAGVLLNLDDVKIGKSTPPSYEAYVHYLRGLAELKTGLYPEQAMHHFESATVLENNFVMPYLFLTWFYRGHKRDSIVKQLKKIENPTRYEANVIEEIDRTLSRDYYGGLGIALKVLQDYPHDYYFNLIAGHRAKCLYMPALSIDVLSKLKDPLQKDLGLVWHYYKVWNYTESLMMLGKSSEAIEYLNSIPADFHSPAIPTLYINAYVLLGKTPSDLEQIIAKLSRNDPKLYVQYYLDAAYEFSLKSDNQAAKYFANKSIAILTTLPEKKTFWYDLIDAQFLAGNFKVAKAILNDSLKVNPDNLELKIYLAYVESALGNTKNGEKIFNQIRDDTLIYWRRHEFEYQADYLKARMYALSGEKERALALVKRSFEKGQFRHHWDFDRDVFLKNIFDEPAFKSIVAPKLDHSATKF